MLPWQRVLEVTAGAVFHDGLGVLGPVRELLSWYPDDVFRYVVASQWHRLAQEKAFVGRALELGDFEGAEFVRSRLRRDLIRLALLLNRRWPPYSKWLGSAFRELGTEPSFTSLAVLHNQVGLTQPLDTSLRDTTPGLTPC